MRAALLLLLPHCYAQLLTEPRKQNGQMSGKTRQRSRGHRIAHRQNDIMEPMAFIPESPTPSEPQPSSPAEGSQTPAVEDVDALAEMVYQELRQEAARFMARERVNHTLQATALANEVFLRMRDQRKIDVGDKDSFLKTASGKIRWILVDHARKTKAKKRGEGAPHFSLDGSEALAGRPHTDLIDLNDAIENLGRVDKRQAEVVELRFFGGLTVEQTARVLDVSERTVNGDWRLAKAWLRRALSTEVDS